MSGFEVAGVILGSLPLLVNSAQSVKKLLKHTKDWWQFEEVFETFISRLREETVLYCLLLKRLLGQTSISDKDYNRLLDGTEASHWIQPHIQKALGEQFDAQERLLIQEKLEKLYEDVQRIHKLLPHEQESDLERFSYRFRTSFSSRKDDLLSHITEGNNQLSHILDEVGKVQQPRPNRTVTVAFSRLHKQANLLHDSLTSIWLDCSCRSAHNVGVTIRLAPAKQETNEATSQIQVEKPFKDQVFDAVLQNGNWRTLMTVETPSEHLNVDATRQEAVHSPEAEAGTALLGKATKVAAQVQQRKQRKLATNLYKNKSTGYLAIPLPENEGSSSSQSTSTFDHFRKKGDSLISSDNHRKEAGYGLINRSKKDRAVFLRAGQGYRSLSPLLITPGFANDGYSMTTDLKRNPRDQGSPNESIENTPRAVDSVCDLIANVTLSEGGDGRHHVFQLGRDARIVLHAHKISHGEATQTKALDMGAVITTVQSRSKRVEMGIRLSVTMLSLATTPWLPANWNRQTPLVLGDFAHRRTRNLSGPYFPHSVPENASKGKPAAQWCARSCLLLLGTSLLELLYGMPINKHPTWEESLDQGEPDDSTLLESAFLWIQRSRVELEEYFGPRDGSQLYEAIRRCIRFEFEYRPRDPERGDSKLAETVYREVVGPLKNCCPEVLAM